MKKLLTLLIIAVVLTVTCAFAANCAAMAYNGMAITANSQMETTDAAAANLATTTTVTGYAFGNVDVTTNLNSGNNLDTGRSAGEQGNVASISVNSAVNTGTIDTAGATSEAIMNTMGTTNAANPQAAANGAPRKLPNNTAATNASYNAQVKNGA